MRLCSILSKSCVLTHQSNVEMVGQTFVNPSRDPSRHSPRPRGSAPSRDTFLWSGWTHAPAATEFAPTPRPTCPPLFTGRKTLPSEIFAAAIHESILTFIAAGTVTVRRRFPFPTRSGMTQRPSRCWIRSISRVTSSALQGHFSMTSPDNADNGRINEQVRRFRVCRAIFIPPIIAAARREYPGRTSHRSHSLQ